MSYRSHELPQRTNDPRQLINKALAEGHLLYITYRDRDGIESKRKIKPIEWVEDYKIRAFCYSKQDERHFVITGIREISLIVSNTDTNSDKTSTVKESSLDQWRAAAPKPLIEDGKPAAQKQEPQFKADKIFSKVQTKEQWQQLIHYYVECLNSEYLQNYLIDQQGDYRFFPSDQDLILRFLDGSLPFVFDAQIKNQTTEIARFITDSEKRDQQLCVGYPVLLTPEGKIAPLFFTPCSIEPVSAQIILRADEYELSYAIVDSLDLDKETFTKLVADINQSDFENLSDKIRATQEAIVLKLEECISQTILRRESTRSKMPERVEGLMLITTPCLFWASKNNITSALIEELEEMSKRPWESIPRSVLQFLNISEPGEYPVTVPFARDNKIYVSPVNDEQRKSSHAALTMPITVVTGPPGTGKSQLVVNIISNAVLEGKSVLFASRNNRAVDVVVARMQTDMQFRGLIRTGSSNVRKEAAQSMLNALSGAANPRKKKEINVLIERYKQTKTTLAGYIDTLDEIRRLKSNIRSKHQQLETELIDLPQELVGLIKQEPITVSAEVIDSQRLLTGTLKDVYENMQQCRDKVETVLQAHLIDNRHRHTLITDIEGFEKEWGSFGEGIRNVSYFISLEALNRYGKLWMQLLEAVDRRLAVEWTSNDVEELEKKLSRVMALLSKEMQFKAQSTNISSDNLDVVQKQIEKIEKALNIAKKPSFSNLFGVRRGPQIKALLAEFNPLLSDLEDDQFTQTPDLKDIQQKFESVKNYLAAVLGIQSLANKRQELEQAERKAKEATGLLDEKTRQDFKRLKLQSSEPTALRQVIAGIVQEIDSRLSSRDEAIAAFQAHINENTSLSAIWSMFQNEIGAEEYAGWTLDSDMSISVLQHFISQWMKTLNAVEIKANIEQLETTISNKGGEEGAAAKVAQTQQESVTQGIEILNQRWLQNIDNMQSVNLQPIRDYANLVREVAEKYDKHKYGVMQSLQESYVKDVITAFPVWATTNLSIKQNLPLKPEIFDLVIIDEASQCDIPSALPLIYRAKQVIVIGDRMQLRHIATLTENSHQLLAAEYNIATEVYSYTQHSLFDLASRSVTNHPGVLLLKEHYRSHHDIIHFSNEAFYDGNLIIKTDMTNRKIPDKVLEKACGIYWLNVRGQTVHPSGGSAANPQEVSAIQKMVPELYERLKQIGWESSVGVVTPYREQKNLLQRWLDAEKMDKVTVGTAHTFQGDEREILFFSPVLANGITDGSLAWLRRTENLLNVAITRARTILIIVGDLDFCLSLPDNNPYKRLADYVCSKPQSVLQSWQELPLFSIS